MTKRSADALQGLDAIVSPAGVQYGSTSKLDDEIQIQMLGAGRESSKCHCGILTDIVIIRIGQEVGRSCCVIKYRGRTIVCDAGSHPGESGLSALPYFDEVDWSTVDAVLVTQ